MKLSHSFRTAFRGLFASRRSQHRRLINRSRLFESLESRLALSGVNGPFDSNPSYDPNGFSHIHAGVTIYVNDQKVTIPIFSTDPEDIHTHDTSGAIHIHPQSPPGHYITLGEVFTAWRTAVSGSNANAVLSSTNLMNNLVDTTHNLQMFVNGVATTAFETYQIHDKDQILLVYGTNPIITVNTNFGPIPVELFENVAPQTVNNFLNYVNGGDYTNSIFHRYVSNFVLQGGGFKSTTTTFSNTSQFTTIPTDPAVVNEFDNWSLESGTSAVITQGNPVIQLDSTADISNVSVGDRIRLSGRTDGTSGTNFFTITAVSTSLRTVTVSPSPTAASANNVAWSIFPRVNITNTLSMAKLGGDPNSATDQFFINLANNDSNLDLQNGGFTVFGRIFDSSLAQVTDSSSSASTLLNGSYTSFVSGIAASNQGGTFAELPLATNSQLVRIQSITGQGEVKGSVFNDADGNGTRGTTETARAGATIFVDANNNQQLDTGEISTLTDASGNYTLRLDPGPYTIRMLPITSLTQTTPSGAYNVTVELGRDVTARVFGVTSLVGPTLVDLVATSDTGSSNTDNVTNLNNSSSQKTLQFTVNGVVSGATVQILSDGVVIGQTTVASGGNGSVTVTTNGTTAIADGTHTITASQVLNGNTTTSSTSLLLKVDTAAPTFTSTAPFVANTGVALNYDAATNEDTTGVAYAIQTPPTGATINATTGVVAWTPATSQLGAQTFTISATDVAGNAGTQGVSLNVTKPPQIRIRLAITDANGNAITTLNVGDTFQLRAFASDVRTTPTGPGAVYHDVTWNGSVASAVANSITRGSSFPQSPSGTIGTGSLDEIGSAAAGALGAGEYLLYTVTMKADAAGTLSFVGNAPDTLPSHDVKVFGTTAAVPTDEIEFGQSPSITVRQVAPGSLAGIVFVDSNSNGTKESSEQAIPSVTITLTGTDTFGAAVSRTATTQTDGSYKFDNLNPGNYKLKETQPLGPLGSLPILDSGDFVGSQGGTVSANDELTITLAEGVNGTNNNFTESVGLSIGGTVATTMIGSSQQLLLSGLDVKLYAADANDQPTGSPIQTTTIETDGAFTFAGLASNTYVVDVETPVFLQAATQQTVLELGNADSLNNVFTPGKLQAKYVSYRDFLSSTPRTGLFAAVTPGQSVDLWSAKDSSWSSFNQVHVTLNSTGSTVRINATRTTGEAMFDEVPATDKRVRVVGKDGNNQLLRIAGGSTSYNLRASTSSSSTASGEGESVAIFGEGESAAHTHETSSFVAAESYPPALASTITVGEGEGESVGTGLTTEALATPVTDELVAALAGIDANPSADVSPQVNSPMSELDTILPDQVDAIFSQPATTHDHDDHDDAIEHLVDDSHESDESILDSLLLASGGLLT